MSPATLAWPAGTLAALAVVEYLSHRYVMHRPTLATLDGVFRRHAVLHHRDGRVDVNVDLPAWYGLLLAAPALALAWLVAGVIPALLAAGVVAAYCVAWTGLHRAFHGVGGGWTTHLPGYRALRSHHLAHHANPTRNFGTAFGPLLDRVAGTGDGR